VRVVLEMAGIKNAFGKQLGSGNPLNNARATIEGLRAQRTVQMVAAERGLTIQELMGYPKGAWPMLVDWPIVSSPAP
jgi:small subunit ribosomal protein S5